MPQTARKDAAAQRAQDKEAKRSGGKMSCAECRRLKLKCNKMVPCESCKRRGCASICPNGSLITGQGTRFVLADTEKLHRKIELMSDRIRQLEDALTIMHRTTGQSEPHPLLEDREALKIKSIIELHAAVEGEEESNVKEEEGEYTDAFGTLAIRDDGASTFYGRSAGSESLLMGEIEGNPHSDTGYKREPTGTWLSDLPPVIDRLSGNFLIPSGTFDIDVDYLVERYLPTWDEALRLIELYLEQAPWFFGAVVRKQIVDEILPTWYGEVSTPSPPYRDEATSVNQRTGHNLALFFILMCHGSLTDMNVPAAPENPDASRWYQLTRAALALEPVLDRPSTVATVQTMAMMAIYQGLSGLENSIEATWGMFGLASKLAQSIGLHRDCARWKLSATEVQKRRGLFWELFITDSWQALATGRLSTFSLPFVDAELPFDEEQTLAEDGTPQPSFPAWKARFGHEIVSAVVQGTLTSKAPKYSVILDLDRKIRDFELPKYAQPGSLPPQGQGLGQTMLSFMPQNYRELTLVYVHRGFFSIALTTHPNDPIKSQYAPSFLAGYRSACDLLRSLRVQFDLFPTQIARFWVLWTHAFSSAIMISSVVRLGPRSKVAPAALLELRSAYALFEEASVFGGRARRFLPILQRHLQAAHTIYVDIHNGMPPALGRNNIFSPSNGQKDDLEIFSGQTHTVSTRSNSSGPRSSMSPPESVPTPELPPAEPPIPSFAGAHPSLVSELRGFDGILNAQINNAYLNNNNTLFSQGLMPVDGGQAPRHGSTLSVSQSQHMEHQQVTSTSHVRQSSYSSRIVTRTAEGSNYAAPPSSQHESMQTQQPHASSSHQTQRSHYTPYPQALRHSPSSNTLHADPSQLQSNGASRPRQELRTQRSRPSMRVAQSGYGMSDGPSSEVPPVSNARTAGHYEGNRVARYPAASSSSAYPQQQQQQTATYSQPPTQYENTSYSNGNHQAYNNNVVNPPQSNAPPGYNRGTAAYNAAPAADTSYGVDGSVVFQRSNNPGAYPSRPYNANDPRAYQSTPQEDYRHHSPQNTSGSSTSSTDDGVQLTWSNFMYSVGSPAAWAT